MATLTTSTITLHGRVNSRIQKLFANGSEVALIAQAFSLTLPTPTDALVTLTTVDAQGLSETRALRLKSEAVPYVPPTPV